ncbi:hypothetical protein L596_015015 [Steinernema carpocapsae]|uniref:Uncharacterized protein n=1 Tax=Steinernema carpocapsae TaxID=34508 RepID=A0A4U5NDM3_STECR|nr:hypothetical protein L596_015015 [Steinernema carpocapsae]
MNHIYGSENDSKPFHFTYEPHLRFRNRFKAISFTYELTSTIPETIQSHFTFRINDTYDSGNDSKLFHFTYEPHLCTIPEKFQSHFTLPMNHIYGSENDSKPFHFTYEPHLRFRNRFKAISLYL